MTGAPSGNANLVRLCRLAQSAAHLKPLVFEQLLHTPLLHFGEPSNRGERTAHPLLVGCQIGSKPTVAHVVLSDVAYAQPFAGEMERLGDNRTLSLYPFDSGIELLTQLVPRMEAPLVVDMLQPHAVLLPSDEARAWLAAWQCGAPSLDPLNPRQCVVSSAHGHHSDVLLDRLGASLACWPAVEQAWLPAIQPEACGSWQSTLVLQCSEPAAVRRIERMLPLLNYRLPKDEPPISRLLWLDRFPPFALTVCHLPPVYHRVMAMGATRLTGS